MNIAEIEKKTRFLTKTNSTDLPAAILLILENNAYEKIVGEIIKATMGSNWTFGDSNFTSRPTGKFTLVNGQEDYQLAGDGLTSGIDSTTPMLNILGVDILDENGIYYIIDPISFDDIRKLGLAISEYEKTAGRPNRYLKREDFLTLKPAPDNGVSVTLVNGLRVHFQRTAEKFTSAEVTTGTKIPGFNSSYHDYLSFEPAYQYALANGLPNRNALKAESEDILAKVIKFYTKRDLDERHRIINRQIRHR